MYQVEKQQPLAKQLVVHLIFSRVINYLMQSEKRSGPELVLVILTQKARAAGPLNVSPVFTYGWMSNL